MSNTHNITMVVWDTPRGSKTWSKKRVSLVASNPAPGTHSLVAKNLPKISQRSTLASCGLDTVDSGATSGPNTSPDAAMDTFNSLSLSSAEAPLRISSLRHPRKKSGEVVKSALKCKESDRPKSMATIPTKFVHFDAQLEYIKLFMKGEKPQTISNPGSDVEDGTSSDDDYYDQDDVSLSIRLPNFPPPVFSCYHAKVLRIDSVSLSDCKKDLVGSIQVANLAYHKNVSVRYTFDFWQTVEEVSASFRQPTTKKFDSHIGIDEFSFRIDLEKRVSLELGSPKKTLFFAVKYLVNGQEYWDNNDGMNYHVEFVLSKTRNGAGPWDVPQSPGISTKSQPIDIKRPTPDTSDFLFASSPESPLSSFKSASVKKLSSRYDFSASLSAALLTSDTCNRKKQLAPSQYLDFPTSDQIDRQCEPYYSPAYSSPSSFSQVLNHEYDSYSSASVESPFGNNSWEEPTYLVNAYDRFSQNYVSNTPSYIAPKSVILEGSATSPRSEDGSNVGNNQESYISPYSSPAACIRG